MTNLCLCVWNDYHVIKMVLSYYLFKKLLLRSDIIICNLNVGGCLDDRKQNNFQFESVAERADLNYQKWWKIFCKEFIIILYIIVFLVMDKWVKKSTNQTRKALQFYMISIYFCLREYHIFNENTLNGIYLLQFYNTC